jgi:hypothetical protein
VKNADLAQDGFAALIDEAKIDILKVPDLINTVGHGRGLAAVPDPSAGRGDGQVNWRTLAIDAHEEWQQKQISWTGMPDMMVAFLNAVAGAADIPSPACSASRPRACSRTATARSAIITRWCAPGRTSSWRRRSTASTTC